MDRPSDPYSDLKPCRPPRPPRSSRAAAINNPTHPTPQCRAKTSLTQSIQPHNAEFPISPGFGDIIYHRSQYPTPSNPTMPGKNLINPTHPTPQCRVPH